MPKNKNTKKFDLNVFVYGTLRKGYNNFRLLAPHRPIIYNGLIKDYSLLSEVRTADGKVRKFYYPEAKNEVPFAVPDKGGYIKGQLMIFKNRGRSEIKHIVDKLDILESHPRFYKRTPSKIHYTDDGKKVKTITAYMYVYQEHNFSGGWINSLTKYDEEDYDIHIPDDEIPGPGEDEDYWNEYLNYEEETTANKRRRKKGKSPKDIEYVDYDDDFIKYKYEG